MQKISNYNYVIRVYSPENNMWQVCNISLTTGLDYRKNRMKNGWNFRISFQVPRRTSTVIRIKK